MPPKHFIRESDAKTRRAFHAAGFAGIYVTGIWQPILKSSSRGSPLTYLFFGVFCFRIIREHVDGGDAIPILETLENDAPPCFRLLADDLTRFGLDGDALFGDADELILVIRCDKGYDLVAAAEIRMPLPFRLWI